MNIFAKASKENLLFKSKKGLIVLGDLWTFPVTALRDMANTLNRGLTKSDDLFATPVTSENIDKLRLEIIMEVLAVREEEASSKVTAKENAQRRTMLRELIAKKKLDKLADSDLAELEAELAKT